MLGEWSFGNIRVPGWASTADFFGSEGCRRVKARDQFVKSQQLCHPHQIQDRDSFLKQGTIKEEAVMFSIDLWDALLQVILHADS